MLRRIVGNQMRVLLPIQYLDSYVKHEYLLYCANIYEIWDGSSNLCNDLYPLCFDPD
jgi:hypothetical protein